MKSESKATIRIMIVDSSQEEADSYLNAFRETGYATRAKLVNNFEALAKALPELPGWDLLILINQPDFIETTQVVHLINKNNLDLPLIVLTSPDDDIEPLSLIKEGAGAVIPVDDDDDYLLTFAVKEFEALQARRHLRRMSVALNESEKQRRLLLDDQTVPVVYIANGAIQYANSAFNDLIKLPKSEKVIGQPFSAYVSDRDQKDVEAFLMNVEQSGQALAAIQCSLKAKGDEEIVCRTIISATSYNERFTLSLKITVDQEDEGIKDIPDQVFHSSEQASYDSNHFDQFKQLIDVAVQKAVAGKEKSTLCCIYSDTANKAGGGGKAEVSPQFVELIAAKIASFFGVHHPFSSLGGGSFITLIREGDEGKARRIINNLLASVTATDVVLDNQALSVRLSIGAMILGDTCSDAKTLLSQCRHAAVLAHRQGGNQVSFYQRRQVKQVHSVEKQLAGMVSQALNNKKLKLRYQPIVPLTGSSIEYYEASLDIIDAQGRAHNASVFRPKLEKISLWNKVDQWQLVEASKALKLKRNRGSDTRILLQVGGYSVTDDKFLPWMRLALKTAGVPCSAMAIELSEPNIARYSDKMPAFFKGLKNMGCQTAIREFGCSVNPVGAISGLDVDLIMLDQSFTQDIDERSKLDELQKMIVALNQKGKQVIVSGIETAEEMAPVWQFGADFIQGNFMHGPSEKMDFDFGSEG